jgi:hypothetical protein
MNMLYEVKIMKGTSRLFSSLQPLPGPNTKLRPRLYAEMVLCHPWYFHLRSLSTYLSPDPLFQHSEPAAVVAIRVPSTQDAYAYPSQ